MTIPMIALIILLCVIFVNMLQKMTKMPITGIITKYSISGVVYVSGMFKLPSWADANTGIKNKKSVVLSIKGFFILDISGFLNITFLMRSLLNI